MLFCSLFLLTLSIWQSQFIQSEGKDNVGAYSPDNVKRIVREDALNCPPDPNTCTRYKKFKKTKDLVCYNAKDCTGTFACCPDSCYKHRICKKMKDGGYPLIAHKSGSMIIGPISNNTNTTTTLSPFELVEATVETCPREKSPCATPQDIKKTERFKCVDQCPIHYKCCEDSCFAHKICKKANATKTKVYVQVPKHRNNHTTDSVSTTPTINHTDSESTTPTISSNKSHVNEVTEKPNNESIGTQQPPHETQQPPPETNKQDAECPAENLICSAPLNENDTKQFDCDKTPCPKNFYCCKDNCFAHKICKEASSSNGSDVRISRKREVCPSIQETCLLPADIKHALFCTNDNCTSGLKCCPDACFKRTVCTKPELIIETRIETCPEEPKVCDAFLRGVTIHPRFICSVNMSNCPEDTKCCSDSCHQADLCKTPEVHTVIQKLVPTTTYHEEPQPPGGTPGVSGSPPVKGSQPPGGTPGVSGSQPVNLPKNQNDKPGASFAGQAVTAAPNTVYKDDLQSPGSRESAEATEDHMN